MKKFLSWVLLGGLLIAGCGYTARSSLPAKWRTIYVTSFVNKIDYVNAGNRNLYIPLLEVKVRDGIVSRFQFDGNLKIAKADSADLVLHGELASYSRDVVRYTDTNDVLEYRIHISVNLKLTEGQDGAVVWEEPGFTGEASYFLSGPQAKSEDAAVNDAITDLARRTVEHTIENW